MEHDLRNQYEPWRYLSLDPIARVTKWITASDLDELGHSDDVSLRRIYFLACSGRLDQGELDALGQTISSDVSEFFEGYSLDMDGKAIHGRLSDAGETALDRIRCALDATFDQYDD